MSGSSDAGQPMGPRGSAEYVDPGLQPERTVLSWGRTMVSLFTASCIFLKWIPEHGMFVAVLFVLSLLAAFGIMFSQRHRYHRSARGVHGGQPAADPVGIGIASAVVVVLGALGIYTVLFLSV